MPSYLSHSIMATNLSKILQSEGIETDIDAMRTYSILPDLASTKVDNHNKFMEDYMMYTIKYIKDNKLQNDINVMSMLYGVISHYFLDINTHPYIYSIDFNTKQTSFISNHFLIEGYLNYFLVKEVLKSNILLVKPSYSIKGKISDASKDVIEHAYKKIYNVEVLDSIERNRQRKKI